MKQFIFAVTLIALLFMAPRSQIFANPWDDVWTAIADLQEQISNISLTPGPTGPTGATGPEGLPGPALSGINKDLIYVVQSPYENVTPGLATIVRASCLDNNDPLLSGGYHMSPPQFTHITVVTNAGRPTDSIANWTVAAITDGEFNIDLGQIQAEAYCLRVE